MVTKEQCLLNRALEEMHYGRNQGLMMAVMNAFNNGKQYISEKVFINNESGIDSALSDFTPSQIIRAVLGEDSEYRIDEPFFVVEGDEIRSIDGYDFKEMLGQGGAQGLLTDEVVEELVSAGEIGEAFDDYVSVNYPQDYENIDTYALYDMGYRTEGQILQADWDQLVKELINQRPVSLDENDIRSITNKVISEIKKRRKK